jgi:hypothetical protein
MRLRKTLVVAGATGAMLLAASPAYAWDCIRVSASPQGLQQSSQHGQWEYMTIDDLIAGGVQQGFIDQSQAACVKAGWLAQGEPTSFAIGGGVAGAKGAEQSGHLTDSDFFELAKNAPLKVMVNGKGVDHLDDAIGMIAASCPASPA